MNCSYMQTVFVSHAHTRRSEKKSVTLLFTLELDVFWCSYVRKPKHLIQFCGQHCGVTGTNRVVVGTRAHQMHVFIVRPDGAQIYYQNVVPHWQAHWRRGKKHEGASEKEPLRSEGDSHRIAGYTSNIRSIELYVRVCVCLCLYRR